MKKENTILKIIKKVIALLLKKIQKSKYKKVNKSYIT